MCSDWSATLSPGLTLLVGGDGAGKSTRLRLLAAACRPQAGQLLLTVPPTAEGGESAVVTAWPAPDGYRQHLFWCDTASDVPDGLSASAYANHHRQTQRRWNEDAFDDLLGELALSGHLHKPLLGLSMGMRRKLRLACALASGAPLTLMDDPLAALDRHSTEVVSHLLADCALSQRRVFVSTAYEPPDPDWGAYVIPL